MPFAAIILQSSAAKNVVLGGGENGDLGITTYDATAPQGSGDLLNYQLELTVPAAIELRDDETGAGETVPSAGLTLSVFALYVDGFGTDGMLALAAAPDLIRVEE
jgi:hypothetical protein